jgi:TolA-binding protein
MRFVPFLILLLCPPILCQPLLDRATEAFDRGQWEYCASLCKDFLWLYPEEEEADRACFLLAESLYMMADFEGALKSYEHLLSFYPDSLHRDTALIKVGECLLRLGRVKKAASHLLSIKEDFKERLEYDYIKYLLGFCKRRKKRKSHRSLFSAEQLLRKGKYKEAEVLLRKYLRKGVFKDYARLRLADALYGQGRYKEAAAHYERFYKKSTHAHLASYALYSLIWCHKKLKDEEKVKSLSRILEERFPKSPYIKRLSEGR